MGRSDKSARVLDEKASLSDDDLSLSSVDVASSSLSTRQAALALEKKASYWSQRFSRIETSRSAKVVDSITKIFQRAYLSLDWKKLDCYASKVDDFELRSRWIDEYLEEQGQRQQTTVLLLGATLWSHSSWFHAVKKHEDGSLSSEEVAMCKRIIFATVIRSMRDILDAMEYSGVPLTSEEARIHASTVHARSAIEGNDVLPEAISKAIIALWDDPAVRLFYETTPDLARVRDKEIYYLNNMPRISHPDYIPSDDDACHIYRPTGNIIGNGYSSQFCDENTLLRVVDLPRSSGQRKKWIHHFEGISSILVTIDMRCYAQSLCEDPATNLMSEDAVWWDSVANSQWFQKSHFALCFIKYAEFARMVRTQPLDKSSFKNAFGEGRRLDDPSDPEQAKDFIIDSFLALKRNCSRDSVKAQLIPDLPRVEDWATIKEYFVRSQRE